MNSEKGSSLLVTKEMARSREVELELVLEEGDYIVVPRSSGCGLRRPEGVQIEDIRLLDGAGKLSGLF